MSRKRTPDEPTAEPDTAVATATAEPTESETSQPKPSFAERVGPKKQWASAPDPFEIATDPVAGVRLFESKRDRQMAIKFGDGSREQKPSDAVLDVVRNAGYHWNNEHRIWARKVPYDSPMSTRIDAERLYQEVRSMIRQEKGIETGQEIPF